MATIVKITSIEQLREIRKLNQFTLVKWSATWCGPCKGFAPVWARAVEALPEVEGIAFCEGDVDEISQCKVASVPCIVAYDSEGHKLSIFTGTGTKAEVTKFCRDFAHGLS